MSNQVLSEINTLAHILLLSEFQILQPPKKNRNFFFKIQNQKVFFLFFSFFFLPLG